MVSWINKLRNHKLYQLTKLHWNY